jgi:hypothetical protein
MAGAQTWHQTDQTGMEMNVTTAAIPVSLLALVVSYALWRQGLNASPGWNKYQLYVIAMGIFAFVLIGWLAGVWMS